MIRSDFPLAPYQHEMLDYLKDHDNGFLWVTMGGRKTQTTLAHAEITPDINRVLIVCLKDNIKTWTDEMEKWLVDPKYTMVRGTAKRKQKHIDEFLKSDNKYLVAGYDALKPSSKYKDGQIQRNTLGDTVKNKKLSNHIQSHAKKFDLIIFDESSEIGNHKSDRWKAIYKVARDIPRRIVMDGDPIADGPKKLFAQYQMCDDGETFGASFWDFQNTFWEDEGKPFPSLRLRPGSLDIINTILRDTAFVFTEDDLRRATGLPQTIRKTFYPELNAIQDKHYKQLKKDFFTVIDDIEIDVEYVMDQFHKMRNIFGGFIKTPEGIRRMKSSKEIPTIRIMKAHPSSQIVIWCAYREEIQILSELCARLGVTATTYHGGKNDKEKDIAKNDFNKGKYRVMIAQGGCGIGLNEFVVANVNIYYSNTDRRRHRTQSEKRTIRPTQKAETVWIYDIIYLNTIDEKIYQRLMKKKSESDKMLNYRDLSFLRSIK